MDAAEGMGLILTIELLCDVALTAALVVLVGLLVAELFTWLAEIVRILMVVLGLLGCTQCLCGPAHASTTELALAALCPGHQDFAPHIVAAARRYLLHPVLLVAIMRVESHCRMEMIGTHHEACAMQVHGRAANGYTQAELRDPATCIDTGARWLSLMATWCRDDMRCALGAYNTGRRWFGKRYASEVIRLANSGFQVRWFGLRK
jgi:hypothetical protein